ncbi:MULTISPECIES: gliding motility-associated ABC transporter substrate-binding protein GldG [Flavobacteriaceae]|uniref:Gliding motility-associated ABC transporter substrate-binding protein GldG n=2 Tax=Flavobacteriaceae TaxID=49546 RepID=A0A4Y8AU85_9FLAO|nr:MULTISPECIES: gliding motility-associated ABC transporter substrate-binding protein GldG [Flavobacteriaceae]TEW75444.1 gliding motility-associated ABC transporter substrate-binding protein GldG [Gramella jeungdoensis]GGK45231.1 gliding motility-associated ABC transporter substrate-binding protein GldG [Lutibacter litoralis]
MKNKYSKIIVFLIGIILINYIGSKIYKRFDLTEDKRYTLSKTTENILANVDEIIGIKVYLEGDFPAEFKRLQIETKLHLEELKIRNKNIHFRFINPIENAQELIEKGLEPSRLQVEENGKLSEIVLFPFAEINYKDKTEYVSLLKDIFSNSQDEQLQSSIQNLEYAFAHAIHKVTTVKSKKIAVLRGKGTLDDIYLFDFLKKLGDYYYLAPFSLDAVAEQPQKTAHQLFNYDLAIIAKPTEKFTEEEKYTLDQFVMQGGKTLWTLDNVHAELDSLMQTGESLVYPRDLGLTDLFFNYGVRINPDLISDLYSSQITLATGNIANKTQFNNFQWNYFPLTNSLNNHPINNNIAPVNFKFPNSIDTLKNNITKTVLLQSSPLSKVVGTPTIISLKSISQKQDPANFSNGNKPLAVLLEGAFKSAYSNRVKPFELDNYKENSTNTKMVVISDGDIIANEIVKGKPIELGVHKFINKRYGNKDFLLNTVNYLLDDSGLINLRSKTIKIAFLNKQKAYEEAVKWQLINIIFPLIILGVFGLTFNYFRKKKYS